MESIHIGPKERKALNALYAALPDELADLLLNAIDEDIPLLQELLAACEDFRSNPAPWGGCEGFLINWRHYLERFEVFVTILDDLEAALAYPLVFRRTVEQDGHLLRVVYTRHRDTRIPALVRIVHEPPPVPVP